MPTFSLDISFSKVRKYSCFTFQLFSFCEKRYETGKTVTLNFFLFFLFKTMFLVYHIRCEFFPKVIKAFYFLNNTKSITTFNIFMVSFILKNLRSLFTYQRVSCIWLECKPTVMSNKYSTYYIEKVWLSYTCLNAILDSLHSI